MAATQTITVQSALRPAFVGAHASRSLIDIKAWMPTEIQAISPPVEQLKRLIEGSQCVAGQELDVRGICERGVEGETRCEGAQWRR